MSERLHRGQNVRKTAPAIAGSEDKGRAANQGRQQPLEARKDKERDSSLEAPEAVLTAGAYVVPIAFRQRASALDTLILRGILLGV